MEEKTPQPEPMMWFDRKKGKLDYVLAAVPLVSLAFLAVAYFHTVHPHFQRQQELTEALERVTRLEGEVANHQIAAAQLESQLAEATSRLRDTQMRSRALAERLREALPGKSPDEIQRSAMLRYFTVEEAVQAYLARESEESELKMLASEVHLTPLKSKDLKRNFLYLSHHLYCGSGGCGGPLFEEEYGSYCFVGWAHFRTLPAPVPSTTLECTDISGEIRWLEEEPR